MELIRGQKVKVDQFVSQNDFKANVFFDSIKTIDLAVFGLDKDGKMNDDYMIFFNQLSSPCKGIVMDNKANQACFSINLDKIPQSIDKLVFTAAIDGVGTMSNINRGDFQFIGVDCRFPFVGADFKDERALMIAEIYRKDGVWRLCAVGQGFNGGLDALVKHFGGEVAEAAPTPVAPPKLSLEKKVADKAPGLVNLAKKAQVCLEKKKLTDVKARVAIVLDASGSMSNQYQRGKVQEVVERILPLAVHFDDDGSLECWAFADREKRLPEVTLLNYKDYIKNIAKIKQYGGDIGIGCSNNEPAVIKDIIKFFSKENPSSLPTYIVFITDGGIGSDSEIKRLITDAAKLPIFWQFVGIGGSSYGILKKLDDMGGRVVDNCNFFELDSLSSVTEDKLYDLLLEEFPSWIKEATKKGIL